MSSRIVIERTLSKLEQDAVHGTSSYKYSRSLHILQPHFMNAPQVKMAKTWCEDIRTISQKGKTAKD